MLGPEDGSLINESVNWRSRVTVLLKADLKIISLASNIWRLRAVLDVSYRFFLCQTYFLQGTLRG